MRLSPLSVGVGMLSFLAACVESEPVRAPLGEARGQRGSGAPSAVEPLDTTAAWAVTGGSALGESLGYAVAAAGDVNADGYADALVLAGDWDVFDTGAVHLFLGGADGLAAEPAVSWLELSRSGALYITPAGVGDLDGDGYDDVAIGNADSDEVEIYYGGPDGPAATPDLTLAAATSGIGFGAAVAERIDVNRDGFTDLVVGAWEYSSYTGQVFVYEGSATGVETTAARTLTGEAKGAYFGSSLASLGDTDGDGYDDLAVGAPGMNTYKGRTYVYTGSRTGIGASPDVKLDGEGANQYFGSPVGAAGDVTGDGYADLLVTANAYSAYASRTYLYPGSATGISSTALTKLTGASAYDQLGLALAAAGDLDGDGYGDVVLGAYGVSADTGEVYLYSGSAAGLSSSPTLTWTGDSAGSYFGMSLAVLGDVDADGDAELAVGAHARDDGAGRVTLYDGTPTGFGASATTTLDGRLGDSWFGSSLSTGDLNGDGYDEIIACGFSTDEGEVYVYWGDPVMPSRTPGELLWADGVVLDGAFCSDVVGRGDFNHDGFDDLAVGNDVDMGSYTGRVYLYYGSAAGLADAPDQVIESPVSGAVFGTSVDLAGDVDGDGYDDLLVGAPWVSSRAGAVYLYRGGPTGLESTPSWSAAGTTADAYFGKVVAGAGDLDHDGYDDVLVGAPDTGIGPGSVRVYLGSAAGPGATEAVTWSGEAVDDEFGGALDGLGDLDGDGYDDVVVGAPGWDRNRGRAYVYRGGATLPSTASTTFSGTVADQDLGVLVGSGGDLNGDGLRELLVYSNQTYNSGELSIYLGTSSGVSTTAALTFTGSISDTVGYPSLGGGDMNGDGLDDLLVVSESNTVSLYYGFADGDGDGVGSTTDCDDADPAVGAGTTRWMDGDADGYGGDVVLACGGESGLVDIGGDCDDADAGVRPDAAEVCGGGDEDCDGLVDGADSSLADGFTRYQDADSDGFGGELSPACGGESGLVDVDGDCDDTDAAVYPGAPEVCGGGDADCDGLTDDADPETTGRVIAYTDADGDGWGDAEDGEWCTPPAGTAERAGDCEDTDAAVSPDGAEVCDAADVDEDCDGLVDDADASVGGRTVSWLDADGDGAGGSTSTTACDIPAGYVLDTGDCDDADAAVLPGATEVCDLIDNNCDGSADGADSFDAGAWYADADGDTWTAEEDAVRACVAPEGYTTASEAPDCDDQDATVWPGAPEVPDDGVDQDCDGEDLRGDTDTGGGDDTDTGLVEDTDTGLVEDTDTGAPSDSDTGGDPDTGVIHDSDTGGATDTGKPAEPGCGCAGVPTGGPWGMAALLLVLRRRA